MPVSSRLRWLGRIAAALGIAVALGWLPYQAIARTGAGHLLKLRRELGSLREQNSATRAENARLRAELALYEEDPAAAVERAAREELGLVKPGEIVLKIELNGVRTVAGSTRSAP